jgi:lipopolysaccharide assembly protein A
LRERFTEVSVKLLRAVFWTLLALLFVLLFSFALKNTTPVRLRFFFEQGWDIPLIVLLLIFFVIGVAVGLFASLVRIFGQRREISTLKNELAGRNQGGGEVVSPKPDVPGEAA